MSDDECRRCVHEGAWCEGQRPVGPCNLFHQRAEGRRCAVCADNIAEAGRALCAACTHSYDGPDRKGPGTPDIIRWAAERARAAEQRRWVPPAPLAGPSAAPAHEARRLRARALLIWMEHENQMAALEMYRGEQWLSDHTGAIAALDAELQALLKEG